MIEATLTEALAKSGVVFVSQGVNGTESTARTVPYTEYYSEQTAQIETPVEHIQRAAEDEQRRVEAAGDQ